MATPQYLQMLDQSQRQSAQVLGLMQSGILGAQRNQLQREQMVANIAQDSARLAEQKRMNDFRIQETQSTNNLRAREFEANQRIREHKFDVARELQPLKFEEANLRLENLRMQQKRGLENQAKEEFNAITNPFDIKAALSFSSVLDPDYAKGYLDLKSKYQRKVSEGEAFDQDKFQREFDDLEAEFADREDDTEEKEYDPEVSFLLGQMGNKQAQARYESNFNPQIKQSLPGIRLAMFNATDNGFSGMLEKSGRILGEQEPFIIDQARAAKAGLDSEIEYYSEQIRTAKSELAALGEDDGVQVSQLERILSSAISEKSNAVERRDEIKRAIMRGDPIPQRRNNREEEEERERRSPLGIGRGFGVDPNSLPSPFDDESARKISTEGETVRRLDQIQSEFIVSFGDNIQFDPFEGTDTTEIFAKSGVRNTFLNRITGNVSPIVNPKKVRGLVANNIDRLSDTELASLVTNNTIQKTNQALETVEPGTIENVDQFIDIPVRAQALGSKKSAEIRSVFESKESFDNYWKAGRNEAQRRQRFLNAYTMMLTINLENARRLK